MAAMKQHKRAGQLILANYKPPHAVSFKYSKKHCLHTNDLDQIDSIPPPTPPLTKKIDFYDSKAYTHLDENVKKCKDFDTDQPIPELIKALIEPEADDLSKLVSLFLWFTAHHEDGRSKPAVNDDNSVIYHLHNLKRTTYAVVFATLCGFISIPCVIIRGYLKGSNYSVGITLTDEHKGEWNAVLVNGQWRFIDIFWCSYCIGGLEKEYFERDESYFLMDPDQFIYTHFPEKSSAWQLLETPIDQQEFDTNVFLKERYFEFGMKLLEPKYCHIDCEGYLEIRFELNNQISMSQEFKCIVTRVSDKNPPRKLSPRHVCNKLKADILSVKVRFMSKGRYKLEIIGKDSNITTPGYGFDWIAIFHTTVQSVINESTESGPTDEFTGVLPDEILRMDGKSIELYKKTLVDGKVAVHNIRVMVVGHFEVGKTALTRRLLQKSVDPGIRGSTNGIQVYVRRGQVSLQDRKWTILKKDTKSENTFKLLAKLMSQQSSSNGKATSSATTKKMDYHGDDNTERINKSPEVVGISTDDVTKEENVDISTPSYETDLVAEQMNTYMEDIHDIKELIKYANNLKHDDLNNAELSIWDFAGQSAFYGTHQVFLSPRAVYLLVTDISKHIKDVVKEDECYFDSTGTKYRTITEYVEFWLNSIHGYCASQKKGVPPVILVGTHVDKLDQKNKTELSEQYFEALRDVVVDQVTHDHLVDENFAINNTIIDPKLTDLRDKIFQVASEQQHWGELIPARWLTLENVLNGLEDKGLKICMKESLQKLNDDLPVPLTSDEELSLFLRFQHDTGNIIYFSDAELCDYILLDPQWLVDAFKCLITAKMFVKNKPIYPKWREFNKTAILTHEVIDALWSPDEQPDFHDHRDKLIALMERLDMISRPRSFVADGVQIKVEDFFLAPCMLKNPPDSVVLQLSTLKDGTSTSIICFTMTTGFIPVAVFNRLLSSCLTQWPVSKQSQNYLIYCGVGVFDLDRQHRLTLFFSHNVIQLWVEKFSQKIPQPSTEVCTRVREFIDETLVKLKKQLRETCEFKLKLKCPDVDLRSNSGMFDLNDFLKEDGEVCCHCHDNSHVLISSDMLKYWGFEETVSKDELSEEYRTESDDEEEEAIWQKAMRKCYTKLVSNMEPMSILDRFQEIAFLPDASLRDIRELQHTSSKNRAVIGKVLDKDENGYNAFKKSLNESKQHYLANHLTDLENQIKGEFGSSANPSDELLASGVKINKTFDATKPVRSEAAADRWFSLMCRQFVS